MPAMSPRCHTPRLVSIDLSCQSHFLWPLAFHFLRLRPLLLRSPFCFVVLCPGKLMAVVEVAWLGLMVAGVGWCGLFVVLGLGLLVDGAVCTFLRCLAVW